MSLEYVSRRKWIEWLSITEKVLEHTQTIRSGITEVRTTERSTGALLSTASYRATKGGTPTLCVYKLQAEELERLSF